jgi:hypothetical protein
MKSSPFILFGSNSSCFLEFKRPSKVIPIF